MADKAAQNIQLSQEVIDGIGFVYASHRLVMVRAVQAYKLALEATVPAKARGQTKGSSTGRFLPKALGGAPAESPGPKLLDIPTIITQLEENGHLVDQNSSSISCRLCLQSASGTRLEGWAAQGSCVGSRAPHLGLYARLRAAGSDLDIGRTAGPDCFSSVDPPDHPGGSAACTPCEPACKISNVGSDGSVDVHGSITEGSGEGRAKMDSHESIFDRLPLPVENHVFDKNSEILEWPGEGIDDANIEYLAGPMAGQSSSSAAGGPVHLIEIRTDPPESSKNVEFFSLFGSSPLIIMPFA